MAVDLFPVNQVHELTYEDGAVYGYGLATVGGTQGYHEQRWILFTRDRATQWPPNRAVFLQRARDAAWTNLDEAGFKAKIRTVFDANRHYYVRVNCEQRSGMASLPRPMPRPPFLGESGGGNQPDVGTMELRCGEIVTGYEHAFFTDTNHSYEYWILLNGYASTLNPPNRMGHLRDPETFATVLNTAQWNASATLVACACVYLEALPPLNQM